jgi:hypothetical protein
MFRWLVGSVVWSPRKRRKLPGYRKKNYRESNSEPYCHSFEFRLVGRPLFYQAGTRIDDCNGNKHHRYVLNSKKTAISLVNGDLEIVPKTINNRTFKVQPKTN